MTPLERARYVREHLPAEGLFAEKAWRTAPQPFALSAGHVEILEKLGIVLHRFNTACNLLYRQSAAGKAYPWVAPLLDAGKPEELVARSRDDKVKGQVSAVIRPDLILTEDGFALSEIDSVPGGIGLTAWLAETYSALGENVLGGADGMRKGFASVLNDGEVLISEESASYRPEMEWLIGADRVRSVEDYTSSDKPAYRFFEAFDYPNLTKFKEAWQPGQPLTAPLKPYLEEKLWLALFWSRPLRNSGGRKSARRARNFSSVSSPTRGCSIPRRFLPTRSFPSSASSHGTSWKNSARSSAISSSRFPASPRWPGARAAFLSARTCPAEQWTEQVRAGLGEFSTHPRVLQRFVKGALSKQDYVAENDEIVTLTGRARICPYYFVASDRVTLGGVLATLVPADKKLIHGMRDAILSPVVASSLPA